MKIIMKINKIISIIGIFSAFAFNSLNADVTDITYSNNKENAEVLLKLRTTNPTKKISVLSATVGDKEIDKVKNIKWEDFSNYGYANYIFLVDTSRNNTTFFQRRDDSIAGFAKNIEFLMSSARDRQRFALYEYSSIIKRIVSMPASSVKINNALKNLATSNSTSAVLYQAVDSAISQLKTNNTDIRSAIVLFGTGRTHDIASTIERNIKNAKDNKVLIFTVAKSESDDEKEYLQRYQNLSDSTGGKSFINPVSNANLLDIYNITQSGGKFTIKIPTDVDYSKKLELKLDVEEEGKRSTKIITVNIADLEVIPEPIAQEEVKPKPVDFGTIFEDLNSSLEKSKQSALTQAKENAKKSLDAVKKDISDLGENLSAEDVKGFIVKFEKNIITISEESQNVNNIYTDLNKEIDTFSEKITELEALEMSDEDKEKLAKAKAKLEELKSDREVINTNIITEIDKYKEEAQSAFSKAQSKLFKGAELILAKLDEVSKSIAKVEEHIEKASDKVSSIRQSDTIADLEAIGTAVNTEKAKAQEALAKAKSELEAQEKAKSQAEEKLAVLAEKAQSDEEKAEVEKQKKALKDIAEKIANLKNSIEAKAKDIEGFDALSEKVKSEIEAKNLEADALKKAQEEKKIIIIVSIVAGLLVIFILAFVLILKKKKADRLRLEIEEAKEAERQAERMRQEERIMQLQEEKEAQMARAEQDLQAASSKKTTIQKRFGTLRIIGATNESYPISKESIRLGRDDNNDIVISNDSVSRNHIELTLKSNIFYVIDLGTSNGTFVNGKRMVQAALKSGDIIELGSEVKIEITY